MANSFLFGFLTVVKKVASKVIEHAKHDKDYHSLTKSDSSENADDTSENTTITNEATKKATKQKKKRKTKTKKAKAKKSE